MTGVSLIVCCYNSASRLAMTLEHLSKQVVPEGMQWEVVIVDNGSTDNTKEVAGTEWKKFGRIGVGFKIVEQPIQGLSFARKKGIEESLYDILIFCDDDNWLSNDYVSKGYGILSADSTIGAAGGTGEPVADMELPGWFGNYKYAYACFEQGKNEGALQGLYPRLYGAGMVVRKSALEKLYKGNFVNILSDRSGKRLSSGGDTELSYALLISGFKLWYSPQLKFRHYLPQSRISIDYLFRLMLSIAYSSMSLVIYQYVLSGTRVNFITWIKDFFLRVFLFILDIFKPSADKSTFGFFRAIQISFMPVLAVISLVGQYRKMNKDLSKLRK
jgi:glycosyltransferase involved in cell wall biosynthesis